MLGALFRLRTLELSTRFPTPTAFLVAAGTGHVRDGLQMGGLVARYRLLAYPDIILGPIFCVFAPEG